MRRKICIALFVLFGTASILTNAYADNEALGVRVVVIDAGHGGTRYPGASYGGVYEKDINLQIALKFGALIESNLPYIKVVYTRKTDMSFSDNLNADLQARADIANKADGDIFISIHANAARTREAMGTESLIMGESPLETRANENALYANNKEDLIDMSDEKTAAIVRAYIQNLQFTYGEYSNAMARLIQKRYVKTKRVNRGVRKQPLKVLYASDMPSVLTEVGFMSNADELKYITSEHGQNEIAQVLFNALQDYISFVKGSLLIGDDVREENRSVTSADNNAASSTEASDQSCPEGYTVQIISSKKPVDVNDTQFGEYKGRVAEFKGEGAFARKYCYGKFENRDSAQKALVEVRKMFPSAYIVKFKGENIVK